MWISMDFNGFPSIRRLSLIFVYFRGWGVVAYVAREVASNLFPQLFRLLASVHFLKIRKVKYVKQPSL